MVDIGGNHERLLLALQRHDFDAFHQVMYRTGQRVNFVDSLWIGLHTAVGEHIFEACSNGSLTDQPGAAGMNTHNVVLFGPTYHELLDVRVVQRFIEVVFNVIGRSTHDGCLEFGSFHDALKSTRLPCEVDNKKPGHMAVPGFRGH